MEEINIFIHGLGSSKSVWDTLISDLSEKARDTYNKKFQEYTGNQELDKNSIYYYCMEYDSGFLASQYSFFKFIAHYYGKRDQINSLSIQDLVKQLSTEINTFLNTFRTINIYAHSLGGVIAIHYLLDNKPDVKKFNKVLYFASPFAGSPNSDELVQYSYSRLFGLFKLKPTKILSQLRTSSDYIRQLKKSIKKENNYLKRIDTHFFKAQNDGRIEDPTNLLKLFIEDNEKIHILNFDHSSIVQIDNRDIHRFPLICKSIFGTATNLHFSTNTTVHKTPVNTFETYFKKCPPDNIPDTYTKKIDIHKLLKRYTDEETYGAYNSAVNIFNNTFKICFDLHLTETPKKVTKSDDILFALNENPNFDNLFDIEKVNHLFISEYYHYPKLELRLFSSSTRDTRIISQEDSYKSFKARVLNNQMIFLEGNIGEGKSTILNKLYIDFLEDNDQLESIIIPIYCIVNDHDTNENFLHKINQSILKNIKTSKLYIDFTHKESQQYTTNTPLGKKRVDKLLHSIQKNKISIKDFSSLVIGKDLDTIEKISEDDLYNISKQLIKKDIHYVLIIDNLDSFSYTDERYMFLENTGFEKFNSGVDYVKKIITKLLEYNTRGSITIFSALRPYVLTHLSTNNNIGNTPQNGIANTFIYKIMSDTKFHANESIRTRMNLLDDLLNTLKSRRLDDEQVSEQLKIIIDNYNTIYKSLNNVYQGYQRSPNSIMEKFYNISTEGYRTIISFFNALPMHPDLLKNYLSNSDILLLYKLGLHQKYSQILPYKVNGYQPANLKIKYGKSGKDFNFPNLFLVVSNTICNAEYENACQPNTISYWLKYIVLRYINNNPNASMEQVLMVLSGDKYEVGENYYEPHLVKLSVGSLGTVNEYNCLEYDFHDVSMQTVDELILNTKIKLTTRGKTLIQDDELFDISTLQFLTEDWLLPTPRLEKILNSNDQVSLSLKNELKRLMECTINYEYLTDTDRYSRVLRIFILDKAKLSIWFLTLLEHSLKYEKILYKNAFSNLKFMDSLDKNFFYNQKKRIINRVVEHILKNYYTKNNKYQKDKKELEGFLDLCNNEINTYNIDEYFKTVYSKKVPFICDNT